MSENEAIKRENYMNCRILLLSILYRLQRVRNVLYGPSCVRHVHSLLPHFRSLKGLLSMSSSSKLLYFTFVFSPNTRCCNNKHINISINILNVSVLFVRAGARGHETVCLPNAIAPSTIGSAWHRWHVFPLLGQTKP